MSGEPDVDEMVRQSRRRALQPVLFCTVPGLVLVIIGGVVGWSWVSWAGWALMIFAMVWAGVRVAVSNRKLKASLAEYEAWRSRQ